jgi:ATP-binding cassette, subfamily B, bacterial MsbA
MNEYRRLFRYIRPYLARLVASLLLLVFAGFFEVLTTALAIPLFDFVLAPGQGAASEGKFRLLLHYLVLLPGNILTQLSIALVLLTLFKGLSVYYSNYWMSHVGQSVVMDLRNDLYAHVVGQSIGFFSLNSTGRLMSRLSSDVEQVQEAVSTSIAELFREGVLLFALVAWVLYIDWKLAFLSLLIAPAAFGATLSMGQRIRRVSLKSREDIANLNDQLQQSITGVRIIKAFGTEGREKERFQKSALNLFRSNLKAARIMFINSPLMEMMGVVCFVPLLYYAHARIADHTLTLGAFGGSLFSLFRMYDPIRKLSRLHVQFQRAFASATRVTDVLDTHMAIQDRSDAVVLEGIGEAIEFDAVCFDYGDAAVAEPVLSQINLSVRKQQVIALVGSSGSGKSTLVSLIPRFFDVTAGALRIDGLDVRRYTQESLRRHIAIVTQDTFLFNDTVRYNIAYGNPHAGGDDIIAAARAAFAHDFIMQFPMQYETSIGERGQRLSGGERQRICIARAILKNAPILILDEATSALDSESEKLVQQALANLMQARTTFVIAHRLSTVRNADVIVVLEQGRIEEMGNHDELLARDGLYAHFFRLQTEEAALTPRRVLRARSV